MRGYVPVSCISKNVPKNKDDNSIKSYELSSLKDSLPGACLVRDGCSCRKRLEGEIFFSAKYLSRNWYAWWKRLEGEMFFSVWYLFGLGQSVVTIPIFFHKLKLKKLSEVWHTDCHLSIFFVYGDIENYIYSNMMWGDYEFPKFQT